MDGGKKKLVRSEMLFCAACFFVYFWWAAVQPYNYAPDEAMRFAVTQFLVEHNRLPVADELISHWGFSYAHYPTVLYNQLGYVFMKPVALLTGNIDLHVLAARMVSVVCGTGTVYFTIKASKQLMHSLARWILIVFVAAMPQAVFLNSYVNCDSVVVFGTAVIFYAWSLGMTEGWNYRNAALLAIGVSVCALTYYNSYAWILCSMIFFVVSCFLQNQKRWGKTIKLAAYTAAIVLLMISYSFVRHLILYNDLLGFKTCEYYGELYAIHELKPSVRMSMAEAGIPFTEMLFGEKYKWFTYTWESFIGAFGYMAYFCPSKVYKIVTAIVFLGCFSLLVKFFCSRKTKVRQDPVCRLFLFCLAASAVITVILSIIQSYYRDFQPQGRYCYPALIPLSFAVAKGYEYLLSKIKDRKYRCAVVALVCATMLFLLLFVSFTVFLPSLK